MNLMTEMYYDWLFTLNRPYGSYEAKWRNGSNSDQYQSEFAESKVYPELG